MTHACRTCGSTKAQAMADARTLSLQQELQNGLNTCCQIVSWADEQWLAWVEAAEQDGKFADDVTKPLEYKEADSVLVPVKVRFPQTPRDGGSCEVRREGSE